MPLGEGSVLGRRYRLVAQIGRGGMGRVWHAHDDLLHRDVAVKEVLFPPGLTTSEREVLYERTLREARSAARLSHRGIVTVHDVVEEDGRPWIVMEYVRARSLQEVIDQDGRLAPEQVADIGVQMLAALCSAHDAGVLHRDVKPANVLLDTRATGATRVVITDFGIARIEGDATLTQTGLVLGSPAYIAPERARGEQASAASDLWALGATLYAACEGRAPHDRVEAMAALTSVLTEEPAPPRHAGPLAPLVMGLLSKDPALRVTADRAAEDLERIAGGRPVAAPPDDDATVRDISGGLTMLEPLTLPSGPMPQPPVSDWTAPQPHPNASPARSRGVLVSLAIVVVAVVGVSAAILIYYSKQSQADGTPGTGTSTSAGPTPPPQNGPTSQPKPPSDQIPAGFHRASGPERATVAVPSRWTRQVLGAASVRWTDRATGAYIQVDSIPWGVSDPVEHWRNLQAEIVSKHRLPGFTSDRLGEEFTQRGWRGADLEYTWNSSDHGRMRAYDRGFTANGHQYAIMVAAPAASWSAYAGYPDQLFATFRPAP